MASQVLGRMNTGLARTQMHTIQALLTHCPSDPHPMSQPTSPSAGVARGFPIRPWPRRQLGGYCPESLLLALERRAAVWGTLLVGRGPMGLGPRLLCITSLLLTGSLPPAITWGRPHGLGAAILH